MRKKLKKNGVTLIELLAVIIILSVIAIITVPLTIDIIEKIRRESFKSSAYGIIKAVELSYAQDILQGKIEKVIFTYIDGEEISNVDGKKISYKGEKPQSGMVIINESGQIALALHNGKYCVEKGYNETEVLVSEKTSDECIFKEDNIPPIIVFEPDGSSNYIKSTNVKVSIIDQSIDDASLKYVWKDSEEILSDDEYINSFENMSNIPMPIDSGSFYLHVIAKDTLNNIAREYRRFLLDNDAPIITINGDINITIKKGETYTDLGATAIDNIDSNVEIIVTGTINPYLLGTYIITYTAKDDAGNIATANRTITVVDAEAPVITLNGNNPVNINVGEAYIDAGATAIDDVDGDVTSNIIVTGNVNPSIPGTYTITYTVSDSAGNTSSKTRTVNVIDSIPPIVTLSPNGNSTYAKSHNTIVTVSDTHGTVTTRQYQWTTSATFPSGGTWTNFNSGSTITRSSDSGDYYLHIIATDNVGNEAKVTSNVFKLDNTVPNISSVTIDAINVAETSFTITRSGNASDIHSGLATNPYIYQISTNGSTWTTKCTTTSTSCNVTNLTADTTYYYRICVSDNLNNQACTNSKTIKTNFSCSGTIIDSRDGNVYKIVKIGNQCWFAENLKYTGNGCLSNAWSSGTACQTHTPSWGTEVLYQWLAAMNGVDTPGSQGLCPSGWHIPTDDEFKILEGTVDSNYNVGDAIWNSTLYRGTDVGYKLKSPNYWVAGGFGSDAYGFNSLPTSFRNSTNGTIGAIGYDAHLWTSTYAGSSKTWKRQLYFDSTAIIRDSQHINSGFSVRCIKN